MMGGDRPRARERMVKRGGCDLKSAVLTVSILSLSMHTTSLCLEVGLPSHPFFKVRVICCMQAKIVMMIVARCRQ